ncbi:serine hydrolase domain-containing protein [Fusicatenibacter sp.]
MERKKAGEEMLNAGILLEMIKELEQEAELHSICVLEEGKTVFEGAWAPYSLRVPQMMHSLSKTGTSLCVGMAVSEGKLFLDDYMLDYLRDELPVTYDTTLEKITIRDLLTMQAGSTFCANNVWFTRLTKDWETTWLGQKRNADEIGNGFHYDSGCSYTLSVIVSKVMGKTCLELLKERVFSKMDLPEINWLSSPEGYNTGGWGMYLTAPWIAALGWLIKQNGMWNGNSSYRPSGFPIW